MKYLFLILFCQIVSAETIDGQIFDIEGSKTKPLFFQKTDLKQNADGSTAQTSAITDQSGKVLMRETTLYTGTKVKKQEIIDLASKKKYAAEIDGKKITFFSYELRDDQTAKLVSTKKEENDGPVLTGPVTEPFVRENWDRLKSGETMDVQFAVFEMGKTIGFRFKKKSLETKDGREVLNLEMRPSNFFVKMLVSPMILSFDSQDKTLVHFTGRTPLKIGRGSGASPMDADITYDHKMDRMPASISTGK